MGKRVAIILTITLISGLAIMGYFLQQGHKSLFTDPYKAISPDACIVIESADLRSFINSLTTGKGLAGELGNIREFDTFNRKLKYLADQVNKPGFNIIMRDGEAVIAFFPSEKGPLQPLISVVVAPETRDKHIKTLISASGAANFIESRSGGKSIFQVPFKINNQNDTIYISLLSGLLVGSLSKDLLAAAITQTGKTGDVRNQPGFSRVLLASGKNENRIFFVFPNLESTIKKLLSPAYQSLAPKVASLAGTAGGDIYLNEDGLIVSGYTECIDTAGFLNRYEFLPRKTFNTFKLLPSSTVVFKTEVMVRDTLSGTDNNFTVEDAKSLAVRMKGLAGDEVTMAYLDIRDNPAADNRLFLFELISSAQAEQIFTEASGSKTEVIYFEPDDQVRIPIYRNQFKGLSEYLKPGFPGVFDDSFIAFYNNFMISGSSFAAITRLLYENILNKTLANDLTYREFENSLPSSAGYFFYCVPSRFSEWLSTYLNEDIVSSLRNYKGSLARIQAAGIKMVSSNGMLYNSISLRFREEVTEESTTEWETMLDTAAAVKPFFFTNHNTGAKEIFIQDMKNNAYLINSAGRVLWKVQLSERIMDDIFIIDIFRNGKYQLLFSGKNFLHLLDRNGNYVGRYPVRLRSPATNSLALFDYDNNLNYRIFVAGEDRQIYSYDKNGSTVKGWKPYTTAGTVGEEISYFKVSGKDYLVASDGINLYFLDRSGNLRLTLKEPVNKAKGSALRLTTGAEPTVVCTSADGTLFHIGFDGRVSKSALRQLSPDHKSDFFDIDGDGFGEYVFIDKGTLYLYDHDKKEMFNRDFGTENLAGPQFFIFSASDRKIGVTDLAEKRIHLIDKNGEDMSGFPLKGASMFSIGKLSEKSGWHLIVGGTDRLLYNYKLDTEVK